MINSLDPSRSLIRGLESFDDSDVDITLDIDKMVPQKEDTSEQDEEQYQEDKKTIEEVFDTVDDIIDQDLDHDGNTDIVSEEMLYSTTRHDFLQKYQHYKAEYIGHLNVIDRTVRMHSRGMIGQEDFMDSVKRALTGIVNIFGHLLNLLKTTVFHGWRDFKQGELSDYAASNSLTMVRLYQDDIYYALTKVVVDMPKGMQGTYAEALHSLDDFLNITNMLLRASKMEAISETILEDAYKKNPAFSSHVRDTASLFDNRDTLSAYNKTTKYFTSKSIAKEEFGKLFTSQAEFEQVCKTCMEGDAHLRAVAAVHEKLENTEKNFTKLLDSQYAFNNKELDDISRIIRRFAECFDMYAVVIQDRLRIDHNLTLVVRTIRKSLHM